MYENIIGSRLFCGLAKSFVDVAKQVQFDHKF